MNKTFKIYGIIFLVVIVLLGLLELSKKEITDWRKNFDLKEKSPFGLYVFNQEINQLLNKKLSRTVNSPYAFYTEHPRITPHNILVIQKDLDKTSWEKLINEVKKGSDAMIISDDLPRNLQNSLHCLVTVVNYEETNVLKLTDKKLKKDSIVLDKFPGSNGFYNIDKTIQILGKSDFYKAELQANFLKINFGKGHFYLHTEPIVLTNYYLLKPKGEKYVEDIFSYLPDRETVWFVDTQSLRSQSPLSFILDHPPLKYAWWLLLIGLLLFVIFNAKRKQRIIPIIDPLKNTSVDFVKSIGNLYLQEGDFHDMMAKKAQYFLNKVRMDFLIDTHNLDDNFIKKIQLKTGKPVDKIKDAVDLIKKGQDPYASVMKEDLIKMNKLLDEILN